MNEANLQQNVLMHLIGERPALGGATVAEAATSAKSSGRPSEKALTQMSVGLGANKLLTYQRITVELTRQRLDQLNLPDVDPKQVSELDAVDQIPNLQRLGEAVAKEQVHMDRLLRFFKN